MPEDEKNEDSQEVTDNSTKQEGFVESDITEEFNKVFDSIVESNKEENKEVDKPGDSEEVVEGEEDIQDFGESDNTSEQSEAEANEDDMEDIPAEQVSIARRQGWSDERIVQIATDSPEVLEAMVRLDKQAQVSQREDTNVAEKKSEKVSETSKLKFSEEEVSSLKEKFGEEIEPFLERQNALLNEFNSLRGEFKKSNEQREVDEATARNEAADAFFDKQSKDFSELGTTESLMRQDGSFDEDSPVYKARSEIYDVASLFLASGKAKNWTEALSQGMRWYKGEDAEISLRRKVVKDINKRSKKFTSPPSNKRTKKQFKSREEEVVAEIDKILG